MGQSKAAGPPSALAAFDPEIVTTSFGISDMQVLHITPPEEPCDQGFNFSILHPLFRKPSPSRAIRRERQAVSVNVLREGVSFRKSVARFGVDKDGTGQW